MIFFVKKSSDLNHTDDFTYQWKIIINRSKCIALFFYSTYSTLRRLILQFYYHAIIRINKLHHRYRGTTANAVPIPAVLPWTLSPSPLLPRCPSQSLTPLTRCYRGYCGNTVIPIPMQLSSVCIYSQGNEKSLINCCILAQQEYNWKKQKHDGHVVDVIEQTGQFQKLGKTLARKYEFKKIKNLI